MKRRFTGSLGEKLRFWTAIMRDHTQFLLTNLAPIEREVVSEAVEFRRGYLDLYQELKNASAEPDEALAALSERARRLTEDFAAYKEKIRDRQLTCRVHINQPPTFTQHMINEAEEFLAVLEEQVGAGLQELMAQHLLWLPDASGHAAFIAAGLDPREAQLVETAMDYKRAFDHLYLRADEIDSMLGQSPTMLDVVARLNDNIIEQVEAFQEFLLYLRDQMRQCRILTFLIPLVPDHMAREAQYYLEHVVSE